MIVVQSKNQVPIRLTQERWSHIIRRHPEMKKQRAKVLETLNNPDMVQEGDMGTLIAVKFFPKTPLTEKLLSVIYREMTKDDGFILTAYFANRPLKRRKILWRP